MDEAVKGLAGVERTDDVIAVPPSVGIEVVDFEAAGIGVADDVEPVAAPALSVVWGRQQPFDQVFVGIGPIVLRKNLALVRGWRQADEIEIGAAQQRQAACRWSRRQTLF